MLASITNFNQEYETTHPRSYSLLNGSIREERRSIPFYNINFSYFPTVGDARQTLWVETRTPPPLVRGVMVQLKVEGKKEREVFRVMDVVGSRVVLEPFGGSYYHQSPLTRPSWGYSTLTSPNRSKNWVFGDGRPRGYLIPLN